MRTIFGYVPYILYVKKLGHSFFAVQLFEQRSFCIWGPILDSFDELIVHSVDSVKISTVKN